MTKKELLKILEDFDDDAVISSNHPTITLFISDKKDFHHKASCLIIYEP